MKIILINTLLLCCTQVLGEVPPPYPQRSFRPSPQLASSSNYPQSDYSAPFQHQASLDVKIPARLTIEQLIRLTEQLQNSRNRITNNIPQRIEASSYLPPSRPQPQQIYGPPSKLQTGQFRPPSLPQVNYRPPQTPSQQLPNKFQKPQSTYGVPNIQQSGSSSNQLVPPATSYGVPDIMNIETLEKQQNGAGVSGLLGQNFANDLSVQPLPYKSPTGFRPQGQQNAQFQPHSQIPTSVSQRYLPANGGDNNGEQQLQAGTSGVNNNYPSNTPQNFGGGNNPSGGNGGQNYLPPLTTPKGVVVTTTTTRPTTRRPMTAVTTPASVDGADYDYDLQQPTAAPSNQDGSEAGPNISISNAVAGAGNFFYLQQPDGRLQRVMLQKTQEPNSKPEEYVANYYFQNVQALPNTVYTPLITLGSYVQK